jgi:hypothetical protein
MAVVVAGGAIEGIGAGAVAAGVVVVPELPEALSGVAVVMPVSLPACGAAIGIGAGAVLPGEVPGLVITGALGAPVGAGEADMVWAQAAPADMSMATEANKIGRILSPCL